MGLGDGPSATSGCKIHPHPLVRWKAFHGNLLLYQQQLEAALEIHKLSSELDDIIEQIKEKVGSEKSPCAPSWEWHCLESPMTPDPLCSSAGSHQDPPSGRSVL